MKLQIRKHYFHVLEKKKLTLNWVSYASRVGESQANRDKNNPGNIGNFKPSDLVRLIDMQSVLSLGKLGCYAECVVTHILKGKTRW